MPVLFTAARLAAAFGELSLARARAPQRSTASRRGSVGGRQALARAKGSRVPPLSPSRGRHPSACDLRLPNGDDISEAVSRGTRSADVFRILRTLLAPYFQPIAVYSVARPGRARRQQRRSW